MSLATTEVINPITSATTTLLAPDNVKRKLSESPSELKTVKKCKTDVNAAFIEQTDETIADAIAELIELAPNDASEKNGPNLVSSADVVVEAEENEEVNHPEVIVCPKYGQLVNRREFRRAGPYIIGLKLGHSPVDSIVQYLAKKENTNQFVQLKVRKNFVFLYSFFVYCTIVAQQLNSRLHVCQIHMQAFDIQSDIRENPTIFGNQQEQNLLFFPVY